MIVAVDGLGLVQTYTRTRGSQSTFQTIFGMTGTPTAEYICFGIRILIVVLRQMADAAINLPLIEQIIDSYKEAVSAKYPLLDGVWCTMGGLKLMLECARESAVQNQYYNRWTCDHYISAVFLLVSYVV